MLQNTACLVTKHLNTQRITYFAWWHWPAFPGQGNAKMSLPQTKRQVAQMRRRRHLVTLCAANRAEGQKLRRVGSRWIPGYGLGFGLASGRQPVFGAVPAAWERAAVQQSGAGNIGRTAPPQPMGPGQKPLPAEALQCSNTSRNNALPDPTLVSYGGLRL